MKESRANLKIVPLDPARRRADNKAAVATRIEIAALSRALERGVDAVTVDEVALAAGVSRRTFYRYFATLDEAFSAMPNRAVERLSDELAVRPVSEPIFEALLQVGRATRYSPEEMIVRGLANKVAARSPAEWRRMIQRSRLNSEGMERVVAKRLAATGEDVSHAGLVTAVYLGVVGVVGREHLELGLYGANARSSEQALRQVARLLCSAFPDEFVSGTPDGAK